MDYALSLMDLSPGYSRNADIRFVRNPTFGFAHCADSAWLVASSEGKKIAN